MIFGVGARRIAGMAAVVLAACSGSEGPEAHRPVLAPPSARAPVEPVATPVDAASEAAPADYEVALRDPALLARLEAKGFSLSELVMGSEARTTAELNRLSGFQSI